MTIVVFDIDGVIRDVAQSYRRAIADTVEHYTNKAYRPTLDDIDTLKLEGIWNNDWEASRELIYRYFENQGITRTQINLSYQELVDFFQNRYRGPVTDPWSGYISTEPLLLNPSYLDELTKHQIAWGFFSGATRGSATYVLEQRLGLSDLVLVAMEDAPGKPDPTGLFIAVQELQFKYELPPLTPIIYVGDTIADIQTINNAKQINSHKTWIAIAVLPPHLQSDVTIANTYRQKLLKAGAIKVYNNVQQLTPAEIDLILNLIKKQ